VTERVVEIQSGRLRGVPIGDGSISVFKGIPYAQSPVGELRWRAPQAVEPWSGTRAATEFAPRCPQPDRQPDSISYFGPEPEHEDCLYLNVWSASSQGEARPVMVWFHGGAFRVGSSAVPLFDGAQLAKAGAVIVTVNYRLGRLGFLAHPELTRESGFSGNYGLLDQIAALRWVRANIAAFGGDPDCVTVFGQSAGSISGSLLMASPLAKGLFQRVVGQSGALFGPVRQTCDTGDSIQTLAAAEDMGLAFAQSLGAHSLAQMRALPAQQVQFAPRPGIGGDSKYNPANGDRGVFDMNWPIVDGHALPQSPFEIFSAGKQNDVPLLLGTTANEGATMPSVPSVSAFVALAQADHGDRADKFLKLYPATSDDAARIASRTAFSYRNFYWQNWTWARLQARTGKAPVFYYQFTRKPPIPASTQFAETATSELGAFHCAEIPYVFRNLGFRDWNWSQTDRDLSNAISSYWLNFAKTGDPNGSGLPQWPAFDPTRQMTIEFQDTIHPSPMHNLARLEFWDEYYATQRTAGSIAA
jgi:para-nitrobenzyl esterase